MNWEAVGAVGELVGASAVLFTLVYVAIQVRHSRDLLEENRKIALSQVYSQRAEFRLQQVIHNIDSSTVSRLGAEMRGVTEEEWLKQEMHQRAIIHFDNVLYQHELGLIPEEDMDRFGEYINKNYAAWIQDGAVILPRIQKWRDDNKHLRDDA